MPDPATETDRELLDRLLPGWVFCRLNEATVRVERWYFQSLFATTEENAVSFAAAALRAILARDRETRGEATPETPLLRRVPVQIAAYEYGTISLANDGTLWECDSPDAKWRRYHPLPQPGEDGGE